ncbi:MAG: hypothetical protein WCE79_14690 [Xanthobacteraceae bacterium]
MSKTIKMSIRARGESESPTVDDLLDQIRDYFDILEGVEQAVAEDGRQAIEWRIVNASTNSPITIEAVAFARDYGVNIDRRVAIVTRQTALGLDMLRQSAERPSYFTEKVLLRAERMFERVTNGLSETKIEYGDGLPTLDITYPVAKAAATNTRNVLSPKDKPYKELGSIEGNAQRIERDGFGRRILWVRYRLTGESVKCLVSGEAEKELEDHRIKDVWKHQRVQVYGMLHYKGLGNLKEVEAIRVRFLRDRNELPNVNDILDPDFTGGLRSEDYLARLRDGES